MYVRKFIKKNAESIH